MVTFKIQENEISRIKNFSDYSKKLAVVFPLNDKQTFVVNPSTNKLEIYSEGKSAGGGNGAAQIFIDIKDITEDAAIPNNFVTNIDSFLNLLGKVGTEAFVGFNDKQLVVSDGGKDKFKQTLFVTRNDQEIDEVQNFIKNLLSTPEFSAPIKVDLTHSYNRLNNMASLTKIIGTSDTIQTVEDGSEVKFADNLCIAYYKDPTKTGSGEVFIENNLLPMLRGLDNILISSDKKFVYIDASNYGIKVAYTPKMPKWSYPSDQDIIDITPEAGKAWKFEIDANQFFKTIDKFYGIFQPSFWRYSQVKVETIAGRNELRLFYDDMASEVEVFLPVKVLEQGQEDNIIFELPTCYFGSLKDDLVKNEKSVINLTYNGLEATEPHGTGVIISGEDITVVVAKMTN